MKVFVQKNFIFYLFLLLLLGQTLTHYSEKKLSKEYEPISELYQMVQPLYMKIVIANIREIFSNIIQNNPKPYEDLKINISDEIDKIKINERRHFYEFYRDIRIILGFLRESNLDINGLNIPFENNAINFADYRFCLPFKFYLEDKENTDPKIYIKENPDCSKFYSSTLLDYIKEHQKMPIEEINGKNAFEYIQNFANEFLKFENKNSNFQILMDRISSNSLAFIPLLPEELNSFTISFSNKDKFTTSYSIIKKENNLKKNKDYKMLSDIQILITKEVEKNVNLDDIKVKVENDTSDSDTPDTSDNYTDIPDTTDQNESDIPDTTDQHESDIPDTTDQHETDIPDTTDQHESDIPDTTDQHESDIPDTTDQHETDIPDTTDQHESDIPDTTDQHESDIPDTSDTTKPETDIPDTSDSTKPETDIPDTTKPEDDNTGVILGIVFGCIGGVVIILIIVLLIIRYCRKRKEHVQIDSKAIDLIQFS